MRAKIVTSAISLLVSLYLIEGGFTFSWVGQPNGRDSIVADRVAAAAELGIEYDERTKLEVIEDLIAEGEDAAPTIYPLTDGNVSVRHHLLPLGGIANKTTVGTNESGKSPIYRSDRHGFNNPDAQWDSGTIDWLLVGDSFTHGSTVAPGEEIAGTIRSITVTMLSVWE